MKQELYIVGAGGFGRELYCWLKDCPEWNRDWVFRGFLDDQLSALDDFDYEAGVVGPIQGHIPQPGQVFACGIGNVVAKQKACDALLADGAKFISVVHPTAVVGAHVTLGAGAVVCPGAVLTSDITIGDMALVNLNTTIGHDVRVGKWTTLSPLSNLTGGVQLGDAVFLGASALILPGLSVGDAALVGAGAVVMRDVKPGQRVFGNPARAFS